MIESLVNVFTKNSFLFAKKPEHSSGGFQETLSKYDQQLNAENNYKAPEQKSFNYSDNEEPRNEKYDTVEEESVKDDAAESAEEESDEKSDEVPVSDLQPFFALLEQLGLDKEVTGKLQKLIESPQEGFSKTDLGAFMESLKEAIKNNKDILPKGLLKKVNEFAEKLNHLLKGEGKQQVAESIKDAVKAVDHKNIEKPKAASQNGTEHTEVESGGKNKVDRQIHINNTKHVEMKEIARHTKNIKFRTEADPRFAQDTSKNIQNTQGKQLQLNVAAAANPQNQPQSGGDRQPGTPGQSPSFLKKMESILKTNNQSNNSPEAVQSDIPKAQVHNIKPSFMNRLTSGNFLNQLVNKIQAMTKAGSTLSASVDFKSAEFGDMKLAAEAQGTTLAVKLSNIGHHMRSDILSLKNELDTELRNLGFENIELDFGDGSNQSNGHNAFEDEINKRLSGESVKLPGDHLADLREIDEWMKSAEQVM